TIPSDRRGSGWSSSLRGRSREGFGDRREWLVVIRPAFGARRGCDTGCLCHLDSAISRSSAMRETYPRDMVGYGGRPPDPRWPAGARLAVQFVINYEEGGERCMLHGDAGPEAVLTDIR